MEEFYNEDAVNEWIDAGIALAQEGRHIEALECYERALAIFSEEPRARYQRGLSLRNLGRYAVALVDYERALILAPEESRIWNEKGAYARKIGTTG